MRRVLKRAYEHFIRLGVPRTRPHVIRTLPHDAGAFTQGLAVHNGILYESVGSEPDSALNAIRIDDGQPLHSVPVPGDFAEGIAVIRDRLYQLSWKSSRARVFSLPDLAIVGEYRYPGEGWGLATVPAGLALTDGSSRIRLFSEEFSPQGQVTVRSNGVPLRRLNDLEFVDGVYYANVWFSPDIFVLSSRTGRVLRRLDCTSLISQAAPSNREAVLNGIAYCRNRHSLFVTGKLWPVLFEVNVG